MSSEIKGSCYKDYLSENDLKILKQMEEIYTTSTEITKVKDHIFPPGFSYETAEYCYEKINLNEGDVVLATCAKTGTFWIGDIIQHIICKDTKEYELATSFPFYYMYLEIAPSSRFPVMFKLPLKRKLAFAHGEADIVNVERYTKGNVKVVYVLRNPKDQMVSLYEFLKKIPLGQVEPLLSMRNSGWGKYFHHTIQGDFPGFVKPGEWYPDHILSWYKHRNNKNVYFIYYEDMKRDPEGQIKLLARFLNAPVTDEKAKHIAEATSFDNMKKRKVTGTGEGFKLNIAKANMRKGCVGGWKDYFTVSQSEQIDAIMEEKLKGTDIKFTYEL